MDRHNSHRENLIMAARASPPIQLGIKATADQRRAQIIEALQEGKESQAEIGRRFGMTARSVSKIKMRHMNKPAPPERAPEIVAAEEELARLERRQRQELLLAQAKVYEAKALQCLREAKALDDDG